MIFQFIWVIQLQSENTFDTLKFHRVKVKITQMKYKIQKRKEIKAEGFLAQQYFFEN